MGMDLSKIIGRSASEPVETVSTAEKAAAPAANVQETRAVQNNESVFTMGQTATSSATTAESWTDGEKDLYLEALEDAGNEYESGEVEENTSYADLQTQKRKDLQTRSQGMPSYVQEAQIEALDSNDTDAIPTERVISSLTNLLDTEKERTDNEKQSVSDVVKYVEEGTPLAQDIKNAETKDEVFNIINDYCKDEYVAQKVYDYLIESSNYEVDSNADNDDNPYYNRNISGLMQNLYSTQGDKLMLSPNLLAEFNENYEIQIPDENGEPKYNNEGEPETYQLPKTQYYTNVDGKICSLEYEYLEPAYGTTENFAKLTFNEGNSSTELFYGYNDDSYTIYDKEGNAIIEENKKEFSKRMTVLENYTQDISYEDGILSTEEIDEKYATLKTREDFLAESFFTLNKEFGTEGKIDDLYNKFKETFHVGIEKDEVKEELLASADVTSLLIKIKNGESIEEELEAEFERRLQQADDYQELYDVAMSYYHDEDIAKEILNNELQQHNNENSETQYFRRFRIQDGKVEIGLDTRYIEQPELNADEDDSEIFWLEDSPHYKRDSIAKDTIPDVVNDYGTRGTVVEDIKNLQTQRDEIIEEIITKSHGTPTDEQQKKLDELEQQIYGEAFSFLTRGGEYTEEKSKNYEEAADTFGQYNAAVMYAETLKKCETPEEAFKVITGKNIEDGDVSSDDIKKFNDYFGNGEPLNFVDENHTYSLSITLDDNGEFKTDYNVIHNIDGTDITQAFDLSAVLQTAAEACIGDRLAKEKFNEFYGKNEDTINSYIDSYAADYVMQNEDIKNEYLKKITNEIKEDAHEYVNAALDNEQAAKNLQAEYGINVSDYKDKPEELAELIAIKKYIKENNYDESNKYMQYNYTTAKQALFGKSKLDELTSDYQLDMATYASKLSHGLTIGLLATSVIFPVSGVAAKALGILTKAAGYVDNAIDFFNMLSNDQNYKDDDYAGWASNTAFEVLTKAGYRVFSNAAGELSTALLEKTVDGTAPILRNLSSVLNGNGIGQILYKGTAEALIETGISLPYTMFIKTIQGGEYSLKEELLENFIYDFLPYAKGWKTLLNGSGTGFKIYENNDGNGRYYQLNGSSNKIYLDENDRPVEVLSPEGKPLYGYEYDGDTTTTTDHTKGIQTVVNKDGSGTVTDLNTGVKLMESVSDGEKLRVTERDELGNVKSIKETSKDEAGSTVVTEYEQDGKTVKSTTKISEDSDGRVTQSFYDKDNKPTGSVTVNKNGTITETTEVVSGREYTTSYDEKGRPTNVTKPDDTSVEYRYRFGKTTISITDADGYSREFTVDKNGNISAGKFNLTVNPVTGRIAVDENFAKAFETDYEKFIDSLQDIKQDDDSTCRIAATLRAATQDGKDGLKQKILSNLEFDITTNSFKYVTTDKNGEPVSYDIAPDKDGNMLEAIYNIYKDNYGSEEGGFAAKFLSDVFKDANDVLLKPAENIETIAELQKDSDTVLLFNTTKTTTATDENGNEVTIETGHEYVVLEADKDNKTMTIEDPQNPGKKLKVNIEDCKDGVVEGKTYLDGEYVDKNATSNFVGGATSNSIDTIKETIEEIDKDLAEDGDFVEYVFEKFTNGEITKEDLSSDKINELFDELSIKSEIKDRENNNGTKYEENDDFIKFLTKKYKDKEFELVNLTDDKLEEYYDEFLKSEPEEINKESNDDTDKNVDAENPDKIESKETSETTEESGKEKLDELEKEYLDIYMEEAGITNEQVDALKEDQGVIKAVKDGLFEEKEKDVIRFIKIYAEIDESIKDNDSILEAAKAGVQDADAYENFKSIKGAETDPIELKKMAEAANAGVKDAAAYTRFGTIKGNKTNLSEDELQAMATAAKAGVQDADAYENFKSIKGAETDPIELQKMAEAANAGIKDAAVYERFDNIKKSGKIKATDEEIAKAANKGIKNADAYKRYNEFKNNNKINKNDEKEIIRAANAGVNNDEKAFKRFQEIMGPKGYNGTLPSNISETDIAEAANLGVKSKKAYENYKNMLNQCQSQGKLPTDPTKIEELQKNIAEAANNGVDSFEVFNAGVKDGDSQTRFYDIKHNGINDPDTDIATAANAGVDITKDSNAYENFKSIKGAETDPIELQKMAEAANVGVKDANAYNKYIKILYEYYKENGNHISKEEILKNVAIAANKGVDTFEEYNKIKDILALEKSGLDVNIAIADKFAEVMSDGDISRYYEKFQNAYTSVNDAINNKLSDDGTKYTLNDGTEVSKEIYYECQQHPDILLQYIKTLESYENIKKYASLKLKSNGDTDTGTLTNDPNGRNQIKMIKMDNGDIMCLREKSGNSYQQTNPSDTNKLHTRCDSRALGGSNDLGFTVNTFGFITGMHSLEAAKKIFNLENNNQIDLYDTSGSFSCTARVVEAEPGRIVIDYGGKRTVFSANSNGSSIDYSTTKVKYYEPDASNPNGYIQVNSTGNTVYSRNYQGDPKYPVPNSTLDMLLDTNTEAYKERNGFETFIVIDKEGKKHYFVWQNGPIEVGPGYNNINISEIDENAPIYYDTTSSWNCA